ncbi:DUF397 domain-containing protein [Streptomyces sp. E11-3]|uniref:DUF397 domain-containing protein n=1 Tax=Streptomyces sp. E11-3 TaxID=3110112 RepID=UPI0039807DA5
MEDGSHNQGEIHWRKSTYSGGSGTECVETAFAPGATAVRDSKHPQGPHLAFSAATWSGFVHAVQTGQLTPRP